MESTPRREVLVSARTVAKVVLVIFAMIAAAYFVVLIQQALMLVVISLFLCHCNWPGGRLFRAALAIPRWASILVVYFLVMSSS